MFDSTFANRYRHGMSSQDDIDAMCVEALAERGLLPAQPEPVRIELFSQNLLRCDTVGEDLPGFVGGTVRGPNGVVERLILSTSVHTVFGTFATTLSRLFLARAAAESLLVPPTTFETGQRVFGLGFRPVWKQRKMAEIGELLPPIRHDDALEWWENPIRRAMLGLLMPAPLVRRVVEPLAEDFPVFGSKVRDQSLSDALEVLTYTFDVHPALAHQRVETLFQDEGQLVF